MRRKTEVEIWDEEHDISTAVQVGDFIFYADGVTRTVGSAYTHSLMHDPEHDTEKRIRNRLTWAEERRRQSAERFHAAKHEFVRKAQVGIKTGDFAPGSVQDARAQLLELKAEYESRTQVHLKVLAEFRALPTQAAMEARAAELAATRAAVRQTSHEFLEGVEAIEI
jgi:hypothetical protein